MEKGKGARHRGKHPFTALPRVQVEKVEYRDFPEALARQSVRLHSEGKKSKQLKATSSNQAFIDRIVTPLGTLPRLLTCCRQGVTPEETKGSFFASRSSRCDLVLSTSGGSLPAPLTTYNVWIISGLQGALWPLCRDLHPGLVSPSRPL